MLCIGSHFLSVFVIEELEQFTSAGRGRIDVSKSVASRGFLETVCKMYRMLSGESVSQNQTPVDKLRALIRLTPRYAEFDHEMAAAIQKQEGKGNAAALVTLMSDKRNLRIELEVAWFSCKYKDYSTTYSTYTHYGLGNKPNVLRQLLEIDIPRKAAVRAALEETCFEMAVYATLIINCQSFGEYLTHVSSANTHLNLPIQEKGTMLICTMRYYMIAPQKLFHLVLKMRIRSMQTRIKGNAGCI